MATSIATWIYDLPTYLVRTLQNEVVWASLWSELLDCNTTDDVIALLLDYGFLETYASARASL